MRASILFAGMLAFISRGSDCQQTDSVVTLSRVACGECRIVLRRHLVLTADSLSRRPEPQGIAVDAAGRVIVAAPGAPQIFDSRGKYIGTLGRQGKGPGEYQRPKVINASSDSLLVFDPASARLTVLSSGDHVARTVPIPVTTSSGILLAGGVVVISAQAGGRDRIGYPLHTLDSAGRFLASFGTEKPQYTVVDPGRGLRWISQSTDSIYWTATLSHSYSVERWTASGRRLQAFDRRSPLFPPYAQRWMPTPDRPPPWLVLGVLQDTRGLVWVISYVADARWYQGLGRGVRAEGQVVYRWDDYERLFDTVIEVIDPRTGTLLASQRFDETYDAIVPPMYVAGFREGEDGVLRIELHQLRLVGR